MKTAKQFIIDTYGESWLGVDWTAGDVMDAMDDFAAQLESEPTNIKTEQGMICKNKNIEDYAFKNYGRLSYLSTMGIIITALNEFSFQSLPEITYEEIRAKMIDVLSKYNKDPLYTVDDAIRDSMGWMRDKLTNQ
jgi:hypothetical protein